jgi:thiol-disulfide isomerase/thioredoxin
MKVHAGVLMLMLVVIGHAQTPMRNLDGGSFDPAANRGKIVVLAFGSTQLPTAKLAMPGLQKLADRYADRPVAFYWVSVNNDHPGQKNFASDAEIRVFANQYGLHLPILRDPERSAFREFGIDALPTNVIIDRTGKVAYKQVGLNADRGETYNDTIRELDKLLK